VVSTRAAGARARFREGVGPGHKAARQVRDAKVLLDFLAGHLPSLMDTLTRAMIESTPAGRSREAVVLQGSVVSATSHLVDTNTLRVAHFQSNGSGFAAAGHCPGWNKRPAYPHATDHALMLRVLGDADDGMAWSPDADKERSAHTLEFRLSKETQCFVAAPVRTPAGITGFLYAESDKRRVINKSTASLILALTQVLAVAVALSDQGNGQR
jgi:hypothetical protein